MPAWTTIAALLESPQGSTFFALIALLLTSAASFWLQSRRQDGVLPSGIVSTLELLMGLYLVEAAVFGAIWLGYVPSHLMPALARAIHLLTLVSLAWLWIGAPAEDRGRSRQIAIAYVAVLLVSGVLIVMWLGQAAGSTFNYSNLDYAWGAAALLALVLGIFLTFSYHTILGMVTFSVLLLGQMAHHLLAEPFGNMPLVVEAALLLSLPLLFFLRVTDSQSQPAVDQAGVEDQDEEEPTPDEGTVSAFQSYAAQGPASTYEEGSVEALAQQLTSRFKADLCLFAQTDAAYDQLQLVAGYNALRDTTIEPAMLDLADLPRLADALQNEQPLRLWADEREPELDELSAVLRLSFQANLLAMPLTDIAGPQHWLVLLLRLTSPWENEEENNLEKTALDVNRDLARALELELVANDANWDWGNSESEKNTPSSPASMATSAFQLSEEPGESPDPKALDAPDPSPEAGEDAALRERLADLIQENDNYYTHNHSAQSEAPIFDEAGDQDEEAVLKAENERYRQDVERLLSHIDELEGRGGSQAQQSSQVVEALQIENEHLKQSLAAFETGAVAGALVAGGQDVDARRAREELRLAMEQVADLQGQLAAAQNDVMAAESLPAVESRKISGQQMEVLASIAQELRQPLSSVLGYTDLLLGESVGILGALQRKFLERVRKSTERMNTLIDDLIRIAELDEGGYAATRAPVDLGGVIDDAITQLRPQLQEKSIVMRVDLPDELPQLNTDRDALQQILYHLLENADAATPANKEIQLRAVIDSQKEFGDFVLIQVTDSGGGIPEEDLPRVFSRVYRTSNPVIPGVGDTGVGLTIAETLTQALGGRIWVETEAEAGATFSVLLPLNIEEPESE